MKHNYFLAALLIVWCTAIPLQAKLTDLLPKPHVVEATHQTPFALGRAVHLVDTTGCKYLERVLTENGCTLSDDATPIVSVEIVESIEGAFNHNVDKFPDEAYRLTITSEAVKIEALTRTGVIRAAQTLQQLAEGYEGTAAFETLTMTDYPAFKVRGFMHDVGRSFLSFDELKNEIDKLARFKVNVFHWHLTEKLAWRFEVNAYPALTASENMTRYPGQYYTQAQCRELETYAAERGVTVIPEIDMPGHSDVFTKAMGFSMQSDQGVEALKKILDEVVEVFPNAPYIHIGGDEVQITYTDFLKTMANYVRSKGKKVVMWNKLVAGAPTAEQCDMTQMWATSGNVVKGLPNIDCRYNYTNHFDVYADVVGIYKSNIYYVQQGTDDVAGTISAAWNDTKTATETDIIRQNNIYANILASAERAWYGGGKQYIEAGGTTLPNSGDEYDEFADWEQRFLFHKAHSLKNEPIAYVKQSNVHWRITDPFPNGGNNALALPPETSTDEVLPSTFTYNGQTYGTHAATGAGIYLRHIWHPTVPSFFSSPADNQTAYAWTYIYSPKAQEAGAQIEFYTYSRSGNETSPLAGQWDRRGSKIWVNDNEIPAPEWKQTNVSIPQDNATQGLTNENLTARHVVKLNLKEGWNKVFMRLPHVNKGGTARDKWQFTFVLTDTAGVNALDGITYSPTQCIDAAAETVSTLADEIETYIRANYSDAVGYYSPTLTEGIQEKISAVRATLSQDMDTEARSAQAAELNAALDALKASTASAEINQPLASATDEEHWYTFNTPLRESRYPQSNGAGSAITGITATSKATTWKFETRTDGTYNIINASDGTYISPSAANNNALTTSATAPDAGWTLKKADAVGYVIIVSGSAQFNQTTSANGYKVFNWGSGNNTNDPGCKYQFKEVQLPAAPKLSTADHTYWYTFYTPQRGNRYPTAQGANADILGQTTASDASIWKFEKRTDGTFNIVNRQYNLYVSPTATHNTALQTVETEPTAGWEFKDAATEDCYIIVSGSAQFNQTNNNQLGYKVYNWGSGTNTTDTGCQYTFTLVADETPSTGITPIATTATPNLYYDLSGRRVVHPAKGIYIQNGRKIIVR